jgi:hypothetical protein
MANKIDPMFLPTSEARGEPCIPMSISIILWCVKQFEKLTDLVGNLQMSFLS